MRKTGHPSSKLVVFLMLTCVGSFYGLHPRKLLEMNQAQLHTWCVRQTKVLSMWEAKTFFKQMQGRDKNSPQGDCPHLRVSSASLLRQHALSVHLFCSIICICFVTPRCRCNHIWQVGSCTLCGIRRSGRRSWMDEPETKHAVFTLHDAFDIIYLRPRSLL